MNMRNLGYLGTVLAVLLVSHIGDGLAQGSTTAYPQKPVMVVLPSAPGSSAETEARLYTQKMAVSMGQSFVLDYKPGAGQALGNSFVGRAAPDGYTILAASGGFTFVPAFYETNPPYDPVKDFAPISLMSKRSTMFVVRNSLPVNSMQEYIAYARANPGKINFATTGQGANYHLIGAWLHGMTDTKVTFIHYKGGGPLWVDMAAGRLDASPATFLMAMQFVKAGKVRPIANLGLERSPLLPDLQTMEELGYPGFEYPSWAGFLAPAKTPPAIVARLNAEFAKAARAPDVQKIIVDQGGTVIASSPESFARTIAVESARWRKVVKDNNLKLEAD